MDAKKKRNRKKKGNQGKNTGDGTANAEEAVPRSHNHDSAPKENHSGADADDVMSSVGDGVPPYENQEQTSHANQNVANADEAISSVGEVIPCDENHEPTVTQENHKASNTVYAEQRSIGMSDSTVDLDKDRLYEAKLGKLHDNIKQLEDEKSLWLQKVSMMESELEKLHNKVGYHAQDEVLLEEKLNNLQNGYNMLLRKEEVLDNKVKCIEDVNGVLTHQETSLKERLNGLEEINKALQEQVKVLDEASKTTVEENQRLVISVDELESRLQTLEAKIALTEASMTKEAPENQVVDQTNLADSLVHKQTTGPMTMISKGNEQIAERGLNSPLTVTLDNFPISAYANNHQDGSSGHFPEATSSNGGDEILIDVDAHQGFDEPRTSGEIVPVPLDDIQIHEDGPQPPGSAVDTDEVPFTDAPIVGAPFRLISFVARYVSGADLVNQK
ncbi:uncharacterized protein LOC124702322 [Lolium rigidum]|uniref:uncharacterized protein LOC124702322 n=1 Tax=Lolium rigidum TaxID=89674 RepID=UPI001F5C2615|nr:uncharacterized protein LOC124702322 [Lolium rigidum]